VKQKQRAKVSRAPRTEFPFKPISPMTDNQAAFISAWYEGYNVLGHGTAGTGKTFLALGLALEDVLVTRNYDRILMLRSAVQSRDQGFLPGTEEEKMAVFERPYKALIAELLEDVTAYQKLQAMGKYQFLSTSCIRGLTWNDTIIIVDEVENCNDHEIGSINTRVGDNSRIIMVGDTKQTDLRRYRDDACCIPKLLQVTNRMEHMRTVEFGIDDIVRGGHCREWIIAEQEYEQLSSN